MTVKPTWASRVGRDRIRQLYEWNAKGLVDQELLDEVSFSIYERCLSILEVTEAVRGKARCPVCRNDVHHSAKSGETLACHHCHWRMGWDEYKRTYKGKQLFGGGAVEAFAAYVRDFPQSTTPSERMFLIDRVLHECHKFPTPDDKAQLYTRPAAINLIDGAIDDIITLLEGLAYGAGSVPGALERLGVWRRNVMSAAREGYGKD